MKYFINICLLIFMTNVIYCQTNSMIFNHYDNESLTNPAFISKYRFTKFGISYLSDWNGYEGRPQNVNVNGALISVDQMRFAMGFRLDLEQFGFERNYNVGLSYAYNIINKGATLGVGLMPNFGYRSFGVLENDIISNSAQLSSQDFTSATDFSLDFGVFYNSEDPYSSDLDHWYVGLSSNSIPNIIFGDRNNIARRAYLHLLGGIRINYRSAFLEPRLRISYDIDDYNFGHLLLMCHYEYFDYKRYSIPFGFYGDLGFVFNKTTANVFSDGLSSSSYIQANIGVISNAFSGSSFGRNAKLIKGGIFFAYGLGQLANGTTFNAGINVNFKLYNQGI